MDVQNTIAGVVECSGVGLHTGAQVSMRLVPAGAGAGVRFIRTDVSAKSNAIPALAANVSTTQLGTNLTNEAGVSIATVEHLLAACSGLNIDNADVELDGPELPIMDGSSATFCALISTVGVQPQSAPVRRIVIKKPVEVRDGVKWARLSPGEGFSARVVIDYPTRAIGRQEIIYRHADGAFAREIAFARTFGFAHEVEKLRSMGLARGGSLRNALVIDGDTLLNPQDMQAPDEFVRHKLLDVIGDMYLAGARIEGHYEGEQPGHSLNNRLLRAVFADKDAYQLIS